MLICTSAGIRKFLNKLKIINNPCSSSNPDMYCLLLMIQKKKPWLEFPTTGITIGNLYKKERFWPDWYAKNCNCPLQPNLALAVFPTKFVSQQTTHIKYTMQSPRNRRIEVLQWKDNKKQIRRRRKLRAQIAIKDESRLKAKNRGKKTIKTKKLKE